MGSGFFMLRCFFWCFTRNLEKKFSTEYLFFNSLSTRSAGTPLLKNYALECICINLRKCPLWSIDCPAARTLPVPPKTPWIPTDTMYASLTSLMVFFIQPDSKQISAVIPIAPLLWVISRLEYVLNNVFLGIFSE